MRLVLEHRNYMSNDIETLYKAMQKENQRRGFLIYIFFILQHYLPKLPYTFQGCPALNDNILNVCAEPRFLTATPSLSIPGPKEIWHLWDMLGRYRWPRNLELPGLRCNFSCRMHAQESCWPHTFENRMPCMSFHYARCVEFRGSTTVGSKWCHLQRLQDQNRSWHTDA